jgi:hypothetical protein
MVRRTQALALTLVVLAASSAGHAGAAARPQLLVTVSASGGLCPTSVCRWGGRITTTTISADGRRARKLTIPERRALLGAISRLDPAKLPPFTSTCPIAYDGQELSYRFRGKPPLRSCTYDLRRVRAVQLVDRLLASLARR